MRGLSGDSRVSARLMNNEEGGSLLKGRESQADELPAFIEQLSSARSQDEFMATVSHGVRALLRADGATLVLREGDNCYYADEDAISPLWKHQRFPMSACISGWCMANNQSVAIPDIFEDARILADAYRPNFVRSLAMVPVAKGEPVAALGAYWSEKRQPRPEEVERLHALADAVALAMTRCQLQDGDGRFTESFPALKESRGPRAAARHVLGSVVARIRNQKVRPGSLGAFAFAVVCVAIATLLRLVVEVSGLHGLLKFSTYYPMVLLATLVGGRWAGVLASVLGAFAAYWFFMPPLYQLAWLSPVDAVNFSLYAGSCALIIVTIDWYKRAVLHLRLEDANLLTLVREQRHRVRNALVVMESIVNQSLRDEPERAKTISRRIKAGLAEVDLGSSEPVSLRELLVAELEAYGFTQFALEGEDATVSGRIRNLLQLAVHELATNALKYGALSAPEGRVTVAWRAGDGRVTIHWQEAGGAPVQQPQKRGYGSIMLRRLVEAAGGKLTIEFEATGVSAEMDLPSGA